MVHRKELKPPPEVVDAIRASEDGSTAPPEAEINPGAYSANAPRAIRNALVHEEPQRPSGMSEQMAEGGHEGRGATEGGRAVRQAIDAEHVAGHRFEGQQYDRAHVTAGQQGRGAEAVHSKASIMHHNRQQTNKGAGDQKGR